jgi:hypothetical protein
MEFLPFSSVSDEDFLGFFPKNYDLAYDADGEWVYFKGVWYLSDLNEDTDTDDTDPLAYTDPDADDIYDLDFAYY